MGGRIFYMGIQDPLYPLLRVRECISGVVQAGCLWRSPCEGVWIAVSIKLDRAGFRSILDRIEASQQ